MARDENVGFASGNLSRGVRVQWRVVKALILRNMLMRHGRDNIGFLWVVLEPMILTIGVLIMWSIMKSPYERGVHIVAMVMSGYMPLTLWRHTSGAGSRLLSQAISILYHRNLTVWDSVLSRLATEVLGTSLAFCIVYGSLLAAGVLDLIHDPGLMLAAWLMLALLGTGTALIFAGATEFSEVSERLIQPFQYLMIPLSGAFFVVDWLPQQGRDLIWFNPITHCFEAFRAGYFGDTLTTYYTFWYPAAWSLALFTFGFVMLDKAREQIHGG